MAITKTFPLDQFVRKFKQLLDYNQNCRFAFFLGAGCSVSSGIPAASALVKSWLEEMRQNETGTATGEIIDWAEKRYPHIDKNNLGALYNTVISEFFDTAIERQQAVEKFIGDFDPSFGYATLAHLMSHNIYGKNCNVVITTNFDELISDALLLHKKVKPVLISHEYLFRKVRISDTRPTILKLHGEAKIEAISTEQETNIFSDEMSRTIGEILREKALIFVGYGANDENVACFFENIQRTYLPWGIYWVNEQIPNTRFGKWLTETDIDVFHVTHTDFDRMMLEIFNQFDFSHPDETRFEQLRITYLDTFDKARQLQVKQDKTEQLQEKNKQIFKGWWFYEIKAKEYIGKDNEKAEAMYKRGIDKFPTSPHLLGNYAIFLQKFMKDYENAEIFYKRAKGADPHNASILGNYANFLTDIKKDHDNAEKFYKLSIEADPNDDDYLGCYAEFLHNTRHDYGNAEAFLHRAIEVNPNNSTNLAYYADLLTDIKGEYDNAEIFYKRAIAAEPNNTRALFYYATFLSNVRGDINNAEILFKRAIDTDPNEITHLGNYAIFLARYKKDFATSLIYFKQLLEKEPDDASIHCNYGALRCIMGEWEEGVFEFDKALELAKPYDKEIIVACWFHKYCNIKLVENRQQNLEKLVKIINSDYRCEGWDFSLNIDRAIRDGHPNPKLLQVLADVITNKTAATTLNKFIKGSIALKPRAIKKPEKDKIKVFLSYSHKDEKMKEQLDMHLSALKRTGKIDTWNDREIAPGDDWKNEIDNHINEADIILVLISHNFIDSDYCYDKEMDIALQRHKKGEAILIPVILKPVKWTVTPLGALQALPTDGKPVNTWTPIDKGYKKVADGIADAVNKLTK